MFKSKGQSQGVDPNWSTGQTPVEVYDTGNVVVAKSAMFNNFAFNELQFNEFTLGSGGKSAVPVTGKGSGTPIWRFATGEAK